MTIKQRVGDRVRRRVLALILGIVGLMSAGAGTASAADYTEHAQAFITWQGGSYPWPSYFNGYCDVGYQPTGAFFNVVAPTGWTVNLDSVSGNTITFEVQRIRYQTNGGAWVHVDFTCADEV